MKVKNLIDKNKKVALPISMECAEVFKYRKTSNKTKYVDSTYYQTSKMICYSIYKPSYIPSRNDQ